MYTIKIPPKQLENLWKLREFAGQGPIAGQVRRAVEDYIQGQQGELADIEISQTQNAENT